MSEEQAREFQTMLLLGAGASIPAGIPAINKMTEEFFKNPIGNFVFDDSQDMENLDTNLPIISKVTEEFFGQMDLELMMSLIIRMQDKQELELLTNKFSDLKKIKDDELRTIRQLIQFFIRKKCENIQSIQYLWTLPGLPHLPPLDIFTLNYDGTIEIFCEQNSISYTDGFDPNWNPAIFATQNNEFNLYKLHGSLYWFRTPSGKRIKVPMKGLNVSDLKYLTDDSVSEMMIYPAINKNKESMVYSWISQKFKENLNRFEVCIIIGYSFRDEDIKETLKESLTSNNNLWFVIVNPHALEYKLKLLSTNVEISSRIVVMNMGIEEALRERKLHSYLTTLKTARDQEEEAWKSQKGNQSRMDYQWKNVLFNYLRLEHDDRAKWLVEKLLTEKYSDVGNNFPEGIEVTVSPRSLFYALEYKKQGNNEKVKFWTEIFCNALVALEYNWFMYTNKIKLQEFNPVKKDDLPYFAIDSTGSTSLDELIRKINDELKKIESDDEKINGYVSILIETFDFLLTKGRRYVSKNNPEGFMDDYEKDQLGLKKWASKICETLES